MGKQVFHGGCLCCDKQEIKGIRYCNGCMYKEPDWSLPDKSDTKKYRFRLFLNSVTAMSFLSWITVLIYVIVMDQFPLFVVFSGILLLSHFDSGLRDDRIFKLITDLGSLTLLVVHFYVLLK